VKQEEGFAAMVLYLAAYLVHENLGAFAGHHPVSRCAPGS